MNDRLEIASRILAQMPSISFEQPLKVRRALELADLLIKTEKEGVNLGRLITGKLNEKAKSKE